MGVKDLIGSPLYLLYYISYSCVWASWVYLATRDGVLKDGHHPGTND